MIMTTREKIKNWLLHLNEDSFNLISDIAKKHPWSKRYKNKNGNPYKSVNSKAIIKKESYELFLLHNRCMNDIGIWNPKNQTLFLDLCLALIAWISYQKNVKTYKNYKVMAKINDLEKDFTTN